MNSEPLRISILIADLGWMATVFWITEPASLPRHRPHDFPASSAELLAYLFVATAMVWSMLYFWLKLDGFARGWRCSVMSSWLFMGVLILGTILSFGLFPVTGTLPAGGTASMVLLFFVGWVLIRMMAFIGVRRLGGSKRRIVILGEERLAQELAAKIDEHPEMRTQVVGFFTRRDHGSCRAISTLAMVDALKEKSITDLVLVPGQCSAGEMSCLVTACRSAGLGISVVPEHYDLYVNIPRLLDIGGVPLLQIGQPRIHSWMFACKRVLDVTLAIAGGLLCLPPLALAATHLFLRCNRVLECQIRCGRYGKSFSLYRLSVTPGDPANSWLMNLLEQASLTELPQLWNVLCGDMSLVGPRPETPERMKNYSEWHRRRLAVKPGITGWAQIQGLRNGDSSDAKSRFDLQYILNWSPLLDCVIVLETLWTVLARLKRSWLDHRRSIRKEQCWTKPCTLREPHVDRAQSSAD